MLSVMEPAGLSGSARPEFRPGRPAGRGEGHEETGSMSGLLPPRLEAGLE